MSTPSRPDGSAGAPTYAALRDVMRAEILSGKIPAGTRLTTVSLVERFGFSQMPVREALQALHGEGLIEIQPHRGAAVLPLDAARVRNIYDLRAAIEALLVRLAVPNLTNAALARLAQIQLEFRRAVQKKDIKVLFALNNQFHDLLYRYADNHDATVIRDRYASLLGGLRSVYGYGNARLKGMVDDHERILQALRAQDEVQLEMLMRAHVEGAKADLLQRMEAKGRSPGKGRVMENVA